MKYICHRKYNKIGACNELYNIEVGQTFFTIGKYIADDSKAICHIASEDAFKYFAKDDDGQGLERGRLTYEIAYADRHPNSNNGFRFTEAERDMLVEQYGQYIKDNTEYLRFNYDFFNADVNIIKEIANKLGVI